MNRPLDRPHRALLPVVLSGIFMAALDFFIVNVAIPTIQIDLHASAASIQWVVAGYGIVYGALLITGGRLADMFGRRRIWMTGMALFTLTSLACGVAPSAGALVGARLAQGASAALMTPQVLAILSTAFAGEARARAIGAYAFTLGLAAVLGQLIGGALIQLNVFGLGWRAVFLVNLPIGVVALLAAPRVVPESRAPGRQRFDIRGVALLATALGAVTFGLIEGRQQGWPAWTWLSLAGAGVLLVAFYAWQQRLAERRAAGASVQPLLDPALFRERSFTTGLIAQLAYFMGNGSYFLVLALYLQDGRHLDALQSGLVFLSIGVGYMVTTLLARRLAARVGRQVIAVGAVLLVAGEVALLVTISSIGSGGSVAMLIAPLVIHAAGMGLVIGPLAQTILARVPAEHAGAAGGVLATGQQVGNAVGVAVLGVVFYGALGQGHPGQVAHAFSMSVIALLVIAVAVALLTQLMPRNSAAPSSASTRSEPTGLVKPSVAPANATAAG